MRAFTLLEVLVVIAIVALLGAIFLPGLSGAIQASKSTKCKSQLREIYLDCLDWLETSRRLPTASEGGWVAVTPGVMRCPADRVGYLSYQPPLVDCIVAGGMTHDEAWDEIRRGSAEYLARMVDG